MALKRKNRPQKASDRYDKKGKLRMNGGKYEGGKENNDKKGK